MGLIVFLCFFLSGGSGLLFEVLWTRELGLVFGSTTLAMSTVLSVFMGGLALGSYLCGRLVGRIQRPLRAYALVEAGVGLYALSVPLWLQLYPKLNAILWRSVGDHYAVLSLCRFLLTALLLLLPTTLMGATLPLLSQFLSTQKNPRGVLGAAVQIGALFALNTSGAVLGTFLSGFVMLPRLGVSMTNYLGAATNLSLALVILLCERRILQAGATPDPAVADAAASDAASAVDELAPAPPPVVATERQRQLAVAAYAVSGATAMIYQVLWTRALAIVLGSSVYSFTLILLAFLVGLAAGAAVVTRLLPRLRSPVTALGITHALTLITAIWSYLTLDRLPEAFLIILRGASFSVDELLGTQFILAALATLPATLAMGAVMPLTMRIYTASASGAGRDVGVAYALNTVGAITGSFAAGFIVLPSLGLQHGLLFCSAVTAALAAVLLWNGEPAQLGAAAQLAWYRRARRPIAVALCGLTAVFIAFAPKWNLSHFSAGLFRISIAKSIIYLEHRVMPQLLYYKDGISTTVSVEQWGKTTALKNNGKVDASNGDDMGTQIMVGLMPLLFHPTALDKPPRVAVIGYGSGVTIGAVTQFPIGHADVIELEPAVIEAGDRFFADVSHLPSQNPKVQVLVGDGRNFMTQSDSRYDVIVSEPSNPWITGVSNLFTTDYWKLAKSRLADDGVFCQWAQLYELSQPNIKTLLRSFSSVFPHTYVFAAEHLSSDVILVASRQPLPLDLYRLRRNFDNPVLRAELHRAQIDAPEEILADLLLTPDEIPAFTVGAVINTDDNAHIEFAAPRDLLGYMRHESSVPRVYSNDWPYGRFERYLTHQGLPFDQPPSFWEASPGQQFERRADTYARLGRAMLSHGKRDAAVRLLVRALAVGGGEPADALSGLLAMFSKRGDNAHEEFLTLDWDGDDDHFAAGLDPLVLPRGLSEPDQARIRREYGDVIRNLNGRRWLLALRSMREWPMTWVTQMGPDIRLVLGYLLYKADLDEDAIEHLEELEDQADYVQKHPAVLYYLARAQFVNGDPRHAMQNMIHYLKLRDGVTAARR